MDPVAPGWSTVSNDLLTGMHTISDTTPDDFAGSNLQEAIKAAKLLVLLELATISPPKPVLASGLHRIGGTISLLWYRPDDIFS